MIKKLRILYYDSLIRTNQRIVKKCYFKRTKTKRNNAANEIRMFVAEYNIRSFSFKRYSLCIQNLTCQEVIELISKFGRFDKIQLC